MAEFPNPFEAPRAGAEPAATRLVTADASRRLGARIVDNIALVLTLVPGFVATGVDPEEHPFRVLLGMTLFAVPIGLVGWQWWLMASEGTSVGKRAIHIRVVRLDGTPPGFFAGVVLRSWVLGVAGFVAALAVGGLAQVLGLADALLVFSDRGRTLHDRIAGTPVVVSDASDPLDEPLD